MAGAVFHVGDLGVVAAAVRFGAHFIEQGAHGVHNFDVGLFVPTAHVVGLAQAASFQYAADGTAVVFHVQPVTHLHAIAINGQGLTGQGVDNHQRDQLFWKVIWPVIVAAVGGDHRQTVGVVPGAHQVVAGRLAGRVRAVGLVTVVLGKCRITGSQAAIYLVRGNMQQAKGRFCVTR